jgi:HlyD family secretion protein
VSYTAIISAANPDLLLLPGMTASLRIAISDTGNSLKVPNLALRFRPDGGALEAEQRHGGETVPSAENSGTVWALSESGRPIPIAIKLGVSDEQSTQVIEGSLLQNQRVIVGKVNSTNRAPFGIRLGF